MAPLRLMPAAGGIRLFLPEAWAALFALAVSSPLDVALEVTQTTAQIAETITAAGEPANEAHGGRLQQGPADPGPYVRLRAFRPITFWGHAR